MHEYIGNGTEGAEIKYILLLSALFSNKPCLSSLSTPTTTNTVCPSPDSCSRSGLHRAQQKRTPLITVSPFTIPCWLPPLPVQAPRLLPRARLGADIPLPNPPHSSPFMLPFSSCSLLLLQETSPLPPSLPLPPPLP